MRVSRISRPRGLCPQTPSRGLAAPCTPAVLLTVSPRGTPPRPPAYVGVPQVGVGVVGAAVGLKWRKDERRLAGSRGGTSDGWPGVVEGRAEVGREWRKDERRLAGSGGRTSEGWPRLGSSEEPPSSSAHLNLYGRNGEFRSALTCIWRHSEVGTALSGG